MKIILPGGSGQMGTILARAFHDDGHEVVVLSRRPAAAPWRTVLWDGATVGGWAAEVDGADVVFNLAGRSVNCRYNAGNRRVIKESRLVSTRAVGQAIAAAASPPPLWLQSSTATIYLHTLGPAHDEADGVIPRTTEELRQMPDTWRFSHDVAASWEAAAQEFDLPRTRLVLMRGAMLMSPDREGVFDVLLGLARRGLGGTAGSGRQFVSWIHDADFIRAVYYLIDHEDLSGAINISAPHPLPNKDFMAAIRQAYGIPFGLPAAGWMLEIGALFMRTETELLLKSRRVVPGRLLAHGFNFDFPTWPAAAADLVERWRKKEE